MSERRVEHARATVAKDIGPRDRLRRLVRDRSDQQRGSGSGKWCGLVEGAIADEVAHINPPQDRVFVRAWGNRHRYFRTVPMMACVVTTKYFRIEILPSGQSKPEWGVLIPNSECMAGGTNTDERLARVEMRLDRVELFFGRRTASNAHEDHIGPGYRLGQAREIILIARVCMNDSHIETA